jgi:hypothetical protein
MKKILFNLLLCFSFVPFRTTASEPIKQLVDDFLSTDWPTVMLAKEKIENMGSECVPEIIGLLNDCRVYKLQNTADLIYPGAAKFFGHGQIIDYDIDVVCIRAGWLLEELTFRNFGFTGIHLPAAELTDFIRKTFTDYCSVPGNQDQFEQMNENEKRMLIRNLSIERARVWWQDSSRQWNRLSSLVQALNSTDEKTQVKALFYLRNGRTVCAGLNQKFYKSKLSKTIEKLSKSPTSRLSENAKLIMLDSDFSWLALKPAN